MNRTGKKLNRTKVDFTIDATIFAAFLISTAPRLSGLAIHEWLGLAFGAAIITHLLLHWQWIVGITKKLLGRVQAAARLNYLLNLLLFIDVTLIVFTGIMISKVALATLGLQVAESGLWKGLHHTTSDLGVALVAAHLALHGSWIVKTFKKYITAPIAARMGRKPATQLALSTSGATKEA